MYRDGEGGKEGRKPVTLNVSIISVEQRSDAPAVGDFRAITDGHILPAPEMGLSGVGLSGGPSETHTDEAITTTRRSGFF
jgi:hypothetical protein